MSNDLQPILDRWEYRPGEVTVRKVKGRDGREKLQMRLQLGVLQMEADGRPDGQRPHGHESLLEYFEATIEKLKNEGKDESLELTPDECETLRDEALEYYYRYLSLFHLEDYPGVARDTDRNLRAFDLVRDYAKTDADKYSLEQYRPYVIMMNAQARANIALGENDLNSAYSVLRQGMDDIRGFFEDYGQLRLAEKSEEFKTLAKQAEALKGRVPRDPLDVLRDKLEAAVKEERFEEAARLRDKIQKLQDSVS